MAYDSILKEKKVYEDPVTHHSKYTKYVVLYIFLLLIILGASYAVYYQKVLSPSNIFLYDLNEILGDYKKILTYMIPNNLDLNKDLDGTITSGDAQYHYGIIYEENNLEIKVSRLEDSLRYQEVGQESYLELSSLSGKKIHLQDQTSFYQLKNIKENIKNYLTDEKFIKRFYLEGTNPIVEINLVLNTTDIEQIIGINLQEDYEFTFTLKNHAIMNQILDGKLIVRNKTKNTRSVYTYSDKKITYTDKDAKKYQFTLNFEQDDFTFRIYQDEVLYSIFLGKKLEKTYQYTYQVIDQVYNITLNFTEEETEYQYEITSLLEKNGVESNQSLKILLYNHQDTLLEEETSQEILYQNLTKEEKNQYQTFLKNFFLPIREFINEYQNNVEDLDS